MMRKMLIAVVAVLLTIVPMLSAEAHHYRPGAVYVMTNDPAGNEVVVFSRNAKGILTLVDSYSTGGLGMGDNIDPLASQGALILSRNERWLFAVNAGSDEISVFRLGHHRLHLIGTFDSGGTFPVSLTLYHNLLYVLNSDPDGGAANITGFKLNPKGRLKPLPDSTRQLGPGGFHQVSFDKRGDNLVVTQGDDSVNEIHVFSVDEDGLPSAAPVTSPSKGIVPFGFIFDLRNHLLVSEAGSGAVSSYDIQPDSSLQVISPSVENGNNATCWIAGTWRGFVYTANTGSDNISFYTVKVGSGELVLRDAEAAGGAKPIDMATTRDGRFLYVLNAETGTVGMFRIRANGSLKAIGTIGGLPLLYAQGIAAD